MDKYPNPDYQNDWAKKITGNPIHISDAKSGLRGYYCLGCDKEMQAVKFKNEFHKSYFRHNASNIDKDKVECTFSSRVFRERLAEQFLIRHKKLKLPEVYKYPPKGITGNPILLASKSEIEAYSVKSQVSFYEDEEGNIKWGKNVDVDERYLLVRPDITFFDKNENPLLFVEFVITHKLTEEKKATLRRLDINTVQIIVPRASEEEIERSLKSVSKIKWVYNEVEANTEYISIQQGDTEGVSFFDDEQRKLFEESFACRAAQIGNLVRSIRRSLASQSYRRTQRHFEQEISRIEEATARNRTRLDELEREHETEVYSEFESEQVEIERGLIDLGRQQTAFEQYNSELEERYIRKKQQLDEDERIFTGIIRKQHDKGAADKPLGEIYRARQESLQRDTERVRNNIAGIIEEEENFRRYIEQLTMGEFEQFEWNKRAESEYFKQRKKVIEDARIHLESKINSGGEFEEEGDGAIEAIRAAITKKINERDTSGNTELSTRIEAILGIRGFLNSYDDRKETFRRYKTYLEFVRRGTWRKW